MNVMHQPPTSGIMYHLSMVMHTTRRFLNHQEFHHEPAGESVSDMSVPVGGSGEESDAD